VPIRYTEDRHGWREWFWGALDQNDTRFMMFVESSRWKIRLRHLGRKDSRDEASAHTISFREPSVVSPAIERTGPFHQVGV
jgi:hypothetical protein